MCGIVGFFTKPQNPQTAKFLLDGLKALEYRGYDSAGLAFLNANTPKITIIKAVGQVKNLEQKAQKILDQTAQIGIAHTRWATHGGVTEANTHPHYNKNKTLALVHNGIIENYADIKSRLHKIGYTFYSQTDTEIVVKLLDYYLNYKKEHPQKAWENTILDIKGTFAFVAIDSQNKILYFAKNQSPLSIGLTKNQILFASDPTVISQYTNKFIFLQDHTYGTAFYKENNLQFIIYKNKKIIKPKITTLNIKQNKITKEPYKYFMEKEIFEQPSATQKTLEQFKTTNNQSKPLAPTKKELNKASNFSNSNKQPPIQKLNLAQTLIASSIKNKNLIFLACGTSYHAALIASYWFTEKTGYMPQVFLASEFRYLNYNITPNTVAIAISQSGETADLIQAIKKVKNANGKIISIVNVPYSTIDRLSTITLYTKAGPEIGVASTKAFTTQLTILYLLSNIFGNNKKSVLSARRQKEIPPAVNKSRLKTKPINSSLTTRNELQDFINTQFEKDLNQAIKDLAPIPTYLDSFVSKTQQFQKLAKIIAKYDHMFYLGRHINYSVAKEGALKIKEIAYIQAEAYTSGEMKHGPIALVDKKLLTIFVAPKDKVFEKTFSNIQEILARNGKIIVITSKDAEKEFKSLKNKNLIATITVPTLKNTLLYPFLTTIPLQLLALFTADVKGLNIDKPRNLAKSVTVE